MYQHRLSCLIASSHINDQSVLALLNLDYSAFQFPSSMFFTAFCHNVIFVLMSLDVLFASNFRISNEEGKQQQEEKQTNLHNNGGQPTIFLFHCTASQKNQTVKSHKTTKTNPYEPSKRTAHKVQKNSSKFERQRNSNKTDLIKRIKRILSHCSKSSISEVGV